MPKQPTAMPQLRRTSRWPAVVDDVAVRLVAAVVLVVALVGLVTVQWWPFALLAVDFVLRAGLGPQASPVARLVGLVRPRLAVARRPTPAPPKRFAATIGAVLTVAATVVGVLGLTAPLVVLAAVMVVFPLLESAFGLCVGCRVFAVLMRLGVIPDEICLECADLSRRRAAV